MTDCAGFLLYLKDPAKLAALLFFEKRAVLRHAKRCPTCRRELDDRIALLEMTS